MQFDNKFAVALPMRFQKVYKSEAAPSSKATAASPLGAGASALRAEAPPQEAVPPSQGAASPWQRIQQRRKQN